MLNIPRKLSFACVFVVGLFTGGCSLSSEAVDPVDTDGGATDSDTDSDTDTDSGTMDTDTDSDCDHGEWICEELYIVPSEPAGTPPQLNDVCMDASIPVQSNEAARVGLHAYSSTSNLGSGSIDIPLDLADQMVGLPTIEVVSALPTELMQMNFFDFQPNWFSWGLTVRFDASWYAPTLPGEMQVRVIIEVDCSFQDGGIVDAGAGPDGVGDTRIVQSLTNLIWCQKDPSCYDNWVSSGNWCGHGEWSCW